MLPTIQNIHFSRLKIINFGKRLVASIEAFSRIEVPQLEELWLGLFLYIQEIIISQALRV